MATELPLISSANSLQPVMVIVNKLINKIFFIFYFSLRMTYPTLLRFSYTFSVSDINVSVSTAIITDRFIRHYKSSVYRLFYPLPHSKSCPLIFLVFLFFFYRLILRFYDNEHRQEHLHSNHFFLRLLF